MLRYVPVTLSHEWSPPLAKAINISIHQNNGLGYSHNHDRVTPYQCLDDSGDCTRDQYLDPSNGALGLLGKLLSESYCWEEGGQPYVCSGSEDPGMDIKGITAVIEYRLFLCV